MYCCFVIQAINASFHKHKELFKDGVVHIPVFFRKGVALQFCINVSGLKESVYIQACI